MYSCPLEPFQPPARPDRKPRMRESRLPAFADMAEVDAWIEAHKLPLPLWRRLPPEPLDNAPHFADMAELDAWIESCKDPNRWDRHDGMFTEAQWQEARRRGEVRGSGPRPS